MELGEHIERQVKEFMRTINGYYCPEVTYLRHPTPAHSLIYAIIDRSMRDLEKPWAEKDYIDAVAFFAHEGDEPFSFHWCCEALCLDPEDLRRGLSLPDINGITKLSAATEVLAGLM